MKARRDQHEAYFRVTRWVKTALGALLGLAAGVIAVRTHDHVLVIALTLFSGLMLDPPGTTRLARIVADALPGTPDPPKEE